MKGRNMMRESFETKLAERGQSHELEGHGTPDLERKKWDSKWDEWWDVLSHRNTTGDTPWDS